MKLFGTVGNVSSVCSVLLCFGSFFFGLTHGAAFIMGTPRHARDTPIAQRYCSLVRLESTSGLSKLQGVYQMRDSRIKELRDAKVVTAEYVDTKQNLADRFTN